MAIRKKTNNQIQRNKVPLTQAYLKDTYSPPGLSSKERNYILCNLTNGHHQYDQIKTLANNAIESSKIFTIYGNKSCDPIRLALFKRGWVEKLPLRRMNLFKISKGMHRNKREIDELKKILLSSLVYKYKANFIWRTKNIIDRTMDDCRDQNFKYNKLKFDTMWTTKEGLSTIMDRHHWFYEENVADVVGPRTYVNRDSEDLIEFINDYKITACTSLLKWMVSMNNNKRPICSETGNISMNVIVFALNRCKEYVLKQQHIDIDMKPFKTITVGQWNSFLKKYCEIVTNKDVFNFDKATNIQLYISFARCLLEQIRMYRPQLTCEGIHNVWIIKPTCCSRGRGIKMASSLNVIRSLLDNTNNKCVIQKYIEQPILIHDTKFDIRMYYLVTSIYPLVVWSYRDCYLKFSSQQYSLQNFHESIHLTNNAIQRNYNNALGRHPDLPTNNMWELDRYNQYLSTIGHSDTWKNVIYPAMKRSIIGVMLNCQDSIPISRNRFELYGCDFILDKDYKPWLIEINASPDLAATTNVTAEICPNLLTDLIKVVIDNNEDAKALTGNFECIYKQSITYPHYCGTNLLIRGYGVPFTYFDHSTSSS